MGEESSSESTDYLRSRRATDTMSNLSPSEDSKSFDGDGDEKEEVRNLPYVPTKIVATQSVAKKRKWVPPPVPAPRIYKKKVY